MDLSKFSTKTEAKDLVKPKVVIHVADLRKFKAIDVEVPAKEDHAPKFKVSDFKITLITEELRKRILKYYRDKNNSMYDQKHTESISIAETIIEKEGLLELANKASKIKTDMTVKGWKITLSTEYHNIEIQIVCNFKANWIRHYNITVVSTNDFQVVFNDDVPCERTVLAQNP